MQGRKWYVAFLLGLFFGNLAWYPPPPLTTAALLRIKHGSCAGTACCASDLKTERSLFCNNNVPTGNNPLAHTGSLGDTPFYSERVMRTGKISDVCIYDGDCKFYSRSCSKILLKSCNCLHLSPALWMLHFACGGTDDTCSRMQRTQAHTTSPIYMFSMSMFPVRYTKRNQGAFGIKHNMPLALTLTLHLAACLRKSIAKSKKE